MAIYLFDLTEEISTLTVNHEIGLIKKILCTLKSTEKNIFFEVLNGYDSKQPPNTGYQNRVFKRRPFRR